MKDRRRNNAGDQNGELGSWIVRITRRAASVHHESETDKASGRKNSSSFNLAPCAAGCARAAALRRNGVTSSASAAHVASGRLRGGSHGPQPAIQFAFAFFGAGTGS